MQFSLLPLTPNDAPFLAELFVQVRSPEFAMLGLPAASLAQLLEMQYRAQSTGYAAQFPQSNDQIVWVDGERAGRLLVDRVGEAIHLVDIALLEQYRGQGIGGVLLQRLCEESTASKRPLRLTVRFGNPAERLYQRAGFVRTGGDGVGITMELGGGEGEALPSPPQPSRPDDCNDPVEPGLTGRYFRTLVGQTLSVDCGGGVTLEVVLESFEPLKAPQSGVVVDMGDSFSLECSGPVDAVLPPCALPVTTPGAPPLEIFFSPLGPCDGRMRYQALFNRMKQRSAQRS